MLKKYFLIALALGALAVNCQAQSQNPKDEKIAKKAEFYSRAAETRKNAADAQKRLAEQLEERAYRIKIESEESEETRYRNAGKLEMQAGDIRLAASRNYSCAFSNVENAIIVYKVLKDRTKEDKLLNLKEDNLLEALSNYQTAISDYERAADSFSETKGNDPEKTALASEKAATQLEKLAIEK